jgi:hypothetical protein
VYDGWDLLRVSGLILLSCIPLALSVWALLDAAHRPAWAWALAERRQAVWIVIILFGTCTIIGGMIISAWYLAIIRPQVAAAESGHIT